MKDYTIIPNNILRESQLSIPARYLYCVLLRHCGKDDACFPGQKNLATSLGCSERHIRNLIRELEDEGLIKKNRSGYNRANTYTVSKMLQSNRKPVSSLNDGSTPKARKSNSAHLGSIIPIQQGNTVPPNSIYLKGKDKNRVSHKGLEKLRKEMVRLSLIKDKPLRVSSEVPPDKEN